MKLGIISDLQLLANADSTEYDYSEHLYHSLTILKENNIDILIVAGEIGDRGTEYPFKHLKIYSIKCTEKISQY